MMDIETIFNNTPTPWGGTLARACTAVQHISSYDAERELQIDECESWIAMSTDIEWSWQPIDTEPQVSHVLQSTGPHTNPCTPSDPVADTGPLSYPLPDSYN